MNLIRKNIVNFCKTPRFKGGKSRRPAKAGLDGISAATPNGLYRPPSREGAAPEGLRIC